MSRPSWNTLGQYNAKQPGTVQGPMVSPSIPSMKKQKPLYPLVKPGYNSLVYNGTGTAYYRVNEGPYGALNNNKCSKNDTFKLKRRETGSIKQVVTVSKK